MLPNRFSLTASAEEKLKREKLKTGLSPNIVARKLFFSSMENSKQFSTSDIESVKLGTMALEKTIWLGECQTATELLLEQFYPDKSPEQHAKIWALHVQDSL